MNQPPPPLQPYGFSTPVHVDQGIWSSEYLTAAFARANHKVQSIAPEAPAGPDHLYRIYGWISLGLAGLSLVAIVVASRATGNFVGGWIWPLALAAGSTFWFKMFKASNPNLPERAVHAWIYAIHRRQWERVDRLRVSADRDAFLRRLPDAGGAVELPLTTIPDVERYWKEAQERHGLGFGRWMVRSPRVLPRGHQIAQVEFTLHCRRFRQAWAYGLFGLFVALMFGGLALMVTMKPTPDWFIAFPLVLVPVLVALLVVVSWRRKFPMKKVVVFNGVEWRVLSGEWQAPEDRDLRWINAQ